MRNVFIRMGVSVALLSLLFFLIDWNAFIRHIVAANPFLLFIGGLHVFSGVFISTLRWKKVLDFSKILVDRKSAFRLYLEGVFFSNFLPTSFGGDAYRFLALARRFPLQKSEIASSIIFERGIGFIALFIANIVISVIYFDLIRSSALLFGIEICIFIGFALVLALYYLRDQIDSVLNRGTKHTLLNKLAFFFRTMIGYQRPSLLISTLSYSLLFLLNNTIGYFLFLYAFGVEVSFFYVLFVMTVTQIVGVIPISFNSFGLFEGTSVILYGLVGVDPATIFAAILVGRIIVMLMTSIGGFAYFFTQKKPQHI